MITYILIAVAAIFNAAMDRTGDSVAFNKSTFSHRDPKFWCKDVSWQYAKKIFGYKFDVWHISKSLMVICFAFAIIFYNAKIAWYFDILAIGIIWNTVFNLSYNRIFKR